MKLYKPQVFKKEVSESQNPFYNKTMCSFATQSGTQPVTEL